MPALIIAIALSGALVVTGVGLIGFLGKLPPNSFAGIRTPYTRSSDARWYATHREAGPIMILGGVAAISCGLAFLPFAIFGKVGPTLAAAVAIATAFLILVSAIGGWLYGTARAKAQGA